MAITKIKVSNFKSFDELEIDLRPLNVVVGGNASGKSNFLEIFRFIRDWADHGLEDAVSLQGGIGYLANLRIGMARPILLEVSVIAPARAREAGWPTNAELTCRLLLHRPASGSGHQVLESSVWFGDERTEMDGGRIFRTVVGISYFDLDPKLPKRGAPLTGKAHLETDGSNLALVLRNVLQEEASRKRFIRLLQDALPFVEDLRVESFADRSLLLSLKESFGPQLYVPASFLSDGTLQMAALVLALYFTPAAVTVLEEPDRSIHPHLISRLADMLGDVSAKNQVIATTHNPELVKHTALEDLLLVRRDEHGFSRLSRPSESEELKVFLENDLGVEDLYVQNLLDIGHAI